MIHINHERENRVLTLIKEDPQSSSSLSTFSLNTTLETAQTIAIKWARLGLVSYLYDRYYK
jgi:hypothetical protein